MFNRIHSLVYRPGRGWDPVPAAHAEEYADASWNLDTSPVVDKLESRLGSLNGKRVLDIGAGPGQYSVAFARRGARVTWHDISRAYLSIVKRRADEAGVDIEYSLGYMEEASKFVDRQFDLVFCMIAWYYCMDDRGFARLIYQLVRPGGACYIDCNTPAFENPGWLRSALHAINRVTYEKIGHLYPPHGRIAGLLQAYPMEDMTTDYSCEENDRVFFVKKRCC